MCLSLKAHIENLDAAPLSLSIYIYIYICMYVYVCVGISTSNINEMAFILHKNINFFQHNFLSLHTIQRLLY